MQLNPAIAERLDDEEYPVQDAVDFLQGQLDSGLLEGINEGAVCVVRDAIATREEYITELETERDRYRWGLQWMLNNLTGIDHEWAKEACNIARQSLNPEPKG